MLSPISFVVMTNVIMLSVVRLIVIVLSVVAPFWRVEENIFGDKILYFFEFFTFFATTKKMSQNLIKNGNFQNQILFFDCIIFEEELSQGVDGRHTRKDRI